MRIIRFHRRKAFALPMTILAVVSLLILIIGLIALASLERKTARSYSDAVRAEMALNSGLADAISTLSEVATRDDSLVFRIDDPVTPLTPVTSTTPVARSQFFTYGAVFNTTANTWRSIPFFSGERETVTPAPPVTPPRRPHVPDVSPLIQAIRDATTNNQLIPIGRLEDTDYNVPRGKWVDVPQVKSEYKIRYSWWVEDLAGRIDGRTMGIEPRNEGVSTEELGIFTLFNPAQNADGAGPEDTLIARRESLRTPQSARLALPPAEAIKIEPFLYYTPRPAAPPIYQPRVIPQGFGYIDAGRPAMELNAAVASANVIGIADQISRNIPGFASQRQGGFPATENYVRTLAASIIDYADTDSNATLAPGYRGVDSYPFVNELFDRYEWVSSSGGNVQIKVSTFVELWNPSQQAITGTVIFTNENLHQITIPPTGVRTFSPVTFPDASNPLLNQPVRIPPNGFSVLAVGERTYQFPIGAFPPSQLTFSTTTTSDYKLSWNGNVVDYARGKVQRTSGTLNPGPSQRKWKGNASPAHDTGIGQAGDPRASMYINSWVFANNYDANTSWGGRNLKRSISNNAYREVQISRWADRGTDTTPGPSAGSDAVLPPSVAFPPNEPNSAPAFISNRGFYRNLGEIGNVFDPSQWTNVESNASGANPNAGGGYTLAIGRPEFGAFDVEGRRAAQIIDLFDINPGSSNFPESPRINVNTAPREVLRALFAGVILRDDPARPPFDPAKISILGDVFAEAIVNTRNQAPLRGLSDLNLVRRNPTAIRNYINPAATPAARDAEPVFGSIVAYQAGAPPASWDDAGREELFRKVINLVTFQGKAFRIIVTGEALDNRGNILGRRTKEIHVEIRPARDGAGILIPNAPPTIHKLYEKSL
jgi:Tfp pilus assembly protein PilV